MTAARQPGEKSIDRASEHDQAAGSAQLTKSD